MPPLCDFEEFDITALLAITPISSYTTTMPRFVKLEWALS